MEISYRYHPVRNTQPDEPSNSTLPLSSSAFSSSSASSLPSLLPSSEPVSLPFYPKTLADLTTLPLAEHYIREVHAGAAYLLDALIKREIANRAPGVGLVSLIKALNQRVVQLVEASRIRERLLLQQQEDVTHTATAAARLQ